MSSFSMFQCLVCQLLYDNLWKIEKHIKKHDDDKDNLRAAVEVTGPGRRRGMLPIKKITFNECSVPVVKNQIDPSFLQQYESVEAKEEIPEGEEDDRDQIFTNPTTGRRLRRSRLKADSKLKQVTAILKLPDLEDDATEEIEEEMEFIENLSKRRASRLKGSDYYEDNEFVPAGGNWKRVRGREVKSKCAPNDNSTVIRPRRKYVWKKDKEERVPNGGAKKCNYCPATYKSWDDLGLHLLHSHKEESKVIICPVSTCQQPCVRHSLMEAHLRRHINAERKLIFHTKQHYDKDKIVSLRGRGLQTTQYYLLSGQFHCMFCLKESRSLKDLTQHQESCHVGVKLQCPCSSCDKKDFGTSVISLVGHMRIFHNDLIDPYEEKKGKEPYSGRKIKVKVQDETKPFRCPICKLGFSAKYNFRRHFHLHLENNPYACDFPNCDRKFNSDYNLRRHKVLHYDSVNKSFYVDCPICHQTFSRKDKLARHLKEVHKPSDITAEGKPISNARLPYFRRPRFPTYTKEQEEAAIEREKKRFAGSCIASLERSEPNGSPGSGSQVANDEDEATPIPVLKSEAEKASLLKSEDLPAEEIHLVDQIELNDDGSTVHTAGEYLRIEVPSSSSSSRPTVNPKSLNKNGQSLKPVESAQKELFISPQVSINRDPVIKKLSAEDLSAINAMFTRQSRYGDGKTFSCEECHCEFARAWTLELHLKTAHNQTLVQKLISKREPGAESGSGITLMCGTCAYPAKSKTELAKHMKMHDDNRWKCEESGCGMIYDTMRTLTAHINKLHNKSKVKKSVCPHCKKVLPSTKLQRHLRTVHGKEKTPNQNYQKNNKCPVCHIRVTPGVPFQNHVKSHEKESKRPKCMLCHDTFSTPESLRRHIDCVHLGKPLNKIVQAKIRARKGLIKRKKKTSEWYDVLLEKVYNDVSKRTEVLENGEGELQSTAGSEGSDAKEKINECNDEAMTILGC